MQLRVRRQQAIVSEAELMDHLRNDERWGTRTAEEVVHGEGILRRSITGDFGHIPFTHLTPDTITVTIYTILK